MLYHRIDCPLDILSTVIVELPWPVKNLLMGQFHHDAHEYKDAPDFS